MSTIMPTTCDCTSKEGIQNYIEMTTIDFSEPKSSDLYASLCSMARFNHLPNSVITDLYNRSEVYTEKHKTEWTEAKMYDRLMPIAYDIAKLVGFDVKKYQIKDLVDKFVKMAEENLGDDIEKIMTRSRCDAVVYIYNHLQITDFKKFAEVKSVDDALKVISEWYAKINKEVNGKFPHEEVRTKYSLISAAIVQNAIKKNVA